MAGGFAHMTLVDTLCMGGNVLDEITTLTPSMKYALGFYLNFVELGSVSPDYPYLSLFDNNAEGWANVMHYWNTLDLVRNAVPLMCNKKYKLKCPEKCVAWLFGYLAHVVTDFVVHPVVNLKVGPYEQNKREHRVCEINQDIYIFHREKHQEITRAEYIKDTGIASCGTVSNRSRLEPAVSRLWKNCLPTVPGTDFQFDPGLNRPTKPADPSKWHHNYIFMVDSIAEEGDRLPVLTRHLGQYEGAIYPPLKDLDRSFIDSLLTPEGPMSYDNVFRHTQEAVKLAWSQLGQALNTGKSEYLMIPNGNLDTGRDTAGKMIFWKEAV